MSVERVHRLSYAVDAAAPAAALYALVADTAPWPLFLPDTVHTERLDFDGTVERYSHWAGTDGRAGRSLWRRALDAGRRRVDFREERPAGPVTGAAGSWRVEELAPGWSRLLLEQDLTVADGPGTERVLAEAGARGRAAADGLRAVAERWRRLEGLLLSFEESVRIQGPAEPVHAFLYETGSWPGRVAHVAQAEVVEDRPGVQRVRLVSLAEDGSSYPVEEVRVCFPAAGRIVFKRPRPHPLLAAHAGEWSVEPDPGGVNLVCRNDVLLDERAVEQVLGPGADLGRARRYVRELLGKESRAVLGPAGEYAGEPVRALRSV
ncbi:aromatase [Streptomyces sp. 3211.6]|uniref:SRPBCC family protein n=1 Tax=Streptomyces sp. 3211.6 TaxID=1938845 RepID=UPI000EB53B01|nr:SRPBCC family protein [Streptomyces sp. 3211.6]RKS96996.1 aromatase [Streptomyces sp. 3211.6]